jgi:hypothetical protein
VQRVVGENGDAVHDCQRIVAIRHPSEWIRRSAATYLDIKINWPSNETVPLTPQEVIGTMPFKRKIVTPQTPKRSTRRAGAGRQKVRAGAAWAARKARAATR